LVIAHSIQLCEMQATNHVWNGIFWSQGVWMYFCNWSGNLTNKNATSIKFVKDIMQHQWKLRIYECNLWKSYDGDVIT
jgi:hypothetical protein